MHLIHTLQLVKRMHDTRTQIGCKGSSDHRCDHALLRIVDNVRLA
jgi:hypothetical protein